MAITDWTIVRRSLLGRRFLSATTALTVAVAVALMVVIVSVKDAGYRAFERGAGNMHLVVSRDASPLVSVLNAVFYANAPRAPLAWDEYESLASRLPLEFAVPIQQGDSYRGFPVIATTPEYFSAYRPDARGQRDWALREGRFFDETWEVVLGADVAARTGVGVGDEIALTHGMGSGAPPDPGANAEHDHHHPGHDHVHHEYAFRIVGVLEPTGGPQDRALFTPIEGAWIVHAHDRRLAADPHASVTTASDLTDGDRLITGVYLRVAGREGSMLAGGLQQVFDQLRRDTSITVAQPEAQIRNLFRIVSSIDRLFIGLVAVVMASSAIAIMLAMYSATEQRRRQIAVLRVLGFSRGRVFGLVLTESAVLGLVGALAGVGLAILGARIVAGAMRARLGLVIEPDILSQWTLVIATATILMAAAAGIIPAIRAYRVSVAKNLSALG